MRSTSKHKSSSEIMKLLTTTLLLVTTASALGYFLWYKPKLVPSKNEKHSYNVANDNKTEELLLTAKAATVKNYIAHNHFNQQYCFLVDMHMPSGKKRFFVYNLKKDSIEVTGLVAHGSGSDHGDSLIFSNVIGSGCTSIGKYKIGKPYNGRFGRSYKLYGLDSTNSNAYKRFVVLHPYWQVPENEVAPSGICTSLGCPMVSPSFLTQLEPYIDKANKPVLLWIFY